MAIAYTASQIEGWRAGMMSMAGTGTSWKGWGRTPLATIESQKRMARRRRQRWWERLNRDPEVMALRRAMARRQRYRRRHPFSGSEHDPGLRGLLFMRCVYMGITLGGRPPKTRRCTKRLGTRYCWNWRAPGTDRCLRHGRQ